MQVDKINTQLQLSASDLRLKLRAKEEEIRKEVQKVSTYSPGVVEQCLTTDVIVGSSPSDA